MDDGFSDLTDRLIEFRDARDWARFHTTKDLMLSLSLEAAELLELAQWIQDGAPLQVDVWFVRFEQGS